VHFKVNKEAPMIPTYKRRKSLKSLFGPHDKTNMFGRSFASTRMQRNVFVFYINTIPSPFTCTARSTNIHKLVNFHGTYEHSALFIVKIHTHHYFSEVLAGGGGQ
jgi:hypothetical protein